MSNSSLDGTTLSLESLDDSVKKSKNELNSKYQIQRTHHHHHQNLILINWMVRYTQEKKIIRAARITTTKATIDHVVNYTNIHDTKKRDGCCDINSGDSYYHDLRVDCY